MTGLHSFQNVKDKKDKEGLGNCFELKYTKKTWQQNAVCDPGSAEIAIIDEVWIWIMN